MPEYALSFQDQHCHDHWNTIRIWGRLYPPLFGCMFAAGLFLYITFSTRLGGFHLEDEENSPFFKQLDRTAQERLATKRNFLGLGK